VGRERFLDHYRYTPEDMEDLYAAAGARERGVPGDDREGLGPDFRPAGSPMPIYYLRLEIEIMRGAADFDEAVGRICFPQNALAGRLAPDVTGPLP